MLHVSNCGVPQGSVLGPVLFLLYVNDFHKSSNILGFHLFADDSNIFLTDKNFSRLKLTINEQIKYVDTWLRANKLSLNNGKSNFIIFYPIQKRNADSFRVILNNQFLKRENKIKYLGVVIDCHLNWKDNVSYISKKIKRSIGAFSKVSHFVELDILKGFYYALVYPYLTYCLVVWGNTYSSSLNPLFILQKKIVRLITFSHYKDHTNPLFINLKIFKLHDLVFLLSATFMYNFHNNNLPDFLNSFFLDVPHSHNTRLASITPPISFRISGLLNYGKFNIRFFGPKIWNSINESFKIQTKSRFISDLKNSIFQQYINSS